jgi:hypothetical protein
MAPLAKLHDFPLGTLISAHGPRHVWIVDSKAPFARHPETMKLAAKLTAPEQARRYWVFSIPMADHDKDAGSNYTFTGVLANVKAFAFDNFDNSTVNCAVAKFDQLAQADAGKGAVPRGFKSLGLIGKEV